METVLQQFDKLLKKANLDNIIKKLFILIDFLLQ